jgi:hypothetical protein
MNQQLSWRKLGKVIKQKPLPKKNTLRIHDENEDDERPQPACLKEGEAMSDECKLIDNHKVLTIAPRDLALRYLKHECPDGVHCCSHQGRKSRFGPDHGV